jgi:hypothetical protein
MPLAYGTFLGGLTTLIGTPPNILVSNALRDNGLKPFDLFDYTRPWFIRHDDRDPIHGPDREAPSSGSKPCKGIPGSGV